LLNQRNAGRDARSPRAWGIDYPLGRKVGGFYLSHMRPMRLLLLYLAVVFFGAALLAPWLYWLAQWAAGGSATLARISAQPFHRYVNRSLLGIAVVGLWPFLRGIGANSWRAVGLVKPAGNWGWLGGGFALGFASLACVALLAIAAGARTGKADFSALTWVKKFASAALSAGIVGFLEELLFRGALFGALRKAHAWTTALLASSAVYALVHFFQKPVSPTQITWSSGLELLPRMCQGFIDVEMLAPGFFTLLLAGSILCLAYQRTGNLYLSIGLHAGWIFWLKFYGVVTVPMAGASQWFWGSGKLIDGWLALGVLIPVLASVWLLPPKGDALPYAA
jgi:membrane protease YdiL (CAAX protease family)